MKYIWRKTFLINLNYPLIGVLFRYIHVSVEEKQWCCSFLASFTCSSILLIEQSSSWIAASYNTNFCRCCNFMWMCIVPFDSNIGGEGKSCLVTSHYDGKKIFTVSMASNLKQNNFTFIKNTGG